MRHNPKIGPWLDQVRLVGYTKPPREPEQLEPVRFPAAA